MIKMTIFVTSAFLLASCSYGENQVYEGSSQLEVSVTHGVQALDHRIKLPPLTPEQAGQIKVILDQPGSWADGWTKVQQINAYLDRMESY